MNTNFVFPPPQAPIPRSQRPLQHAPDAPSRDSNSLRASVLDAALELGLASNSLVANWMFNNSVEEEDENEEPSTPALKQATSFPLSDFQSEVNGTMSSGTRLYPDITPVEVHPSPSGAINAPQGRAKGQPMAFPDGAPIPPNIPHPPVVPAPSVYSITSLNKLKKPKKETGDGYASDGGYLSEGGRKNKAKKKANGFGNVSKDDSLVVPEERKRKRSLVDAVRRKKKEKDVDVGYATDGASITSNKAKKDKSKSKPSKDKDSGDANCETDGGTKKSKTRNFFKLSGKSSKPDLAKENTPAVPSVKDQMPLPIALRFATTLETTTSLDETRSRSSLAPSLPSMATSSFDETRSSMVPSVPSLDKRTISLGLTLPSAASSKSTVNEIPPLNLDNLPSLSFQPSSADNLPADRPYSPPPSSSTPSHHVSSPPVSFQSQARPPIRDSQGSSGSSSSGASHPRNRTSAGTFSPNTSNISVSTSPATSHSQSQVSSPLISHGPGFGSSSTATGPPQHHSYPHGFIGQLQKVDGNLPPPGKMPLMGSRPTSPPSSAAAANAVAAQQMMSFQIARDVTMVPLMMRREQSDPQLQRQAEEREEEFPPTTMIADEDAESYPRRMSVALPSVAPLNISKGGGAGTGGTGGLRLKIKPSLEKINLLGLRRESKDQMLSGGGTPTPPPISPAPHSAPPPSSKQPPSIVANPPVSAGQYGLPHAPNHPPLLRPLWNGGPMLSPPEISSHASPVGGGGQTRPLRHTFISAPNTARMAQPPPPPSSRSPSRSRLSANPPPPLPIGANQLVAPTVLAYYDIPPPSPPPMGPLPLPPLLNGDGPSRMGSRSVSPLPRSRSPVPPLPSFPTGHGTAADSQPPRFPTPAQLRQRMLDRTTRKLPPDETVHGRVAVVGASLAPPTAMTTTTTSLNIKRGRESPFPAAPISQKSSTPSGKSSSSSSAASCSGKSDESAADFEEGLLDYLRPSPRSSTMAIQPGPLNNQEKKVLDSVLSRREERRSSWIKYDDGVDMVQSECSGESNTRDHLQHLQHLHAPRDGEEADEGEGAEEVVEDIPDDLSDNSGIQGVLDRFTSDDGHHSVESIKSEEQQQHNSIPPPAAAVQILKSSSRPDFTQPPPPPPQQQQHQRQQQYGYAWDDSTTVGDRTSRWSGSIYSRASIMDEEESNSARDRFVQRVEAMLAERGGGSGGDVQVVAPRKSSPRGAGGGGAAAAVPPVPKIPEAFVNRSLRPKESVVPVVGRTMWNKF